MMIYVFQINFRRSDSKYTNKHESYLLGENNISDDIPAELFNKLIDSLVEEDVLGKENDPFNKFEKYGISI